MSQHSVKKHNELLQQRITVYLGYGLFFITAIGLIMNLILWGQPSNDLQSIPDSLTATLLAYTFATIVPPLIGYGIGEWATRTKPARIHHYNGVLFGILGFWLAVLLSSLAPFIPYTLVPQLVDVQLLWSIIPVLGALAVLIPLAVAYAHTTNHRAPLIQYAPYRTVFTICIGFIFLVSSLSMISGLSFGADFVSSFAVLVLPLLAGFLVIFFGATILGGKNGSFTLRLMKSLIVFSFAVIAGVTLIPFLGLLQELSIVGQWSFIAGVVMWIVCIALFRLSADAQH